MRPQMNLTLAPSQQESDWRSAGSPGPRSTLSVRRAPVLAVRSCTASIRVIFDVHIRGGVRRTGGATPQLFPS
jgi:hypothetical protein